ncbi:MAG TPA: hypothetical protein VLE27_14650, partial [Thermoanaerobaculia bacterium]|nr:hypothetical protein [Thermoanaerobaculia bacterium]
MSSRARACAAASLVFFAAACSPDSTAPEADAPSMAPAAVAAGQADDAVVPGELVIRTRDGASADQVARNHGLAVASRNGQFQVLRVPAGQERRMAAQIGADRAVEWAEPNYLRQPTAIHPNLWAFYNPGGLNMRYSR